ncbi:tetratricopeptide repeat protein, partial [Klebsiella pneumoniae]
AVRRKGETSTLSELIRKLRDAENIYKTYAIYYKSLAKLLDKLSDSHGQKDALLKGLAIDDTNPNILYMLARYYADQGDYEASTKQYQKLIELGWIQDNEENI